ncbi:MAG: TlpA family protein disulfide reductase [Cyclobacteriaceae bacterium]
MIALKARDLVQWIFFLGLLGVLLFTDLGTEIKAGFQRFMLHTGLFQPDLDEAPGSHAAADFRLQLESFDGDRINLSDYKGQVVFINFWASWCPPCLAEMPQIEKLYTELSGKGVKFFMVSLDKDPEKARQLLAKKQYLFPAYQLAGALPSSYQVPSIPTTYVISPEGKIVFSKHGLADYGAQEFVDFLRAMTLNQ